MAKAVEILRDNLGEHPAVKAWRGIRPARVEPETITVLKRWKRKSGVYRLTGVGPGGGAVIAKRCPVPTAAVERAIYEKFLPTLPLPSLGCYGSVDEPDGSSAWLFLEEVSGEPYSPHSQEHRSLAARWLAAVHGAGRHPDWEKLLPDRGPEQYLEVLRRLGATAREHRTQPDLPLDGAASVLTRVTEQCEVLEAHWSELEQACSAAPRTLIHGDFVTKNVRVKVSAGGPVLLVFDWEFAGRGVPSTDLAQFTGQTLSPDLTVYRSCLDGWPLARDATLVQRLAECGKFFRLLDVMSWAARGLKPGRPEVARAPLIDLRCYAQRMERSLSEAGWS